VILVEALQKWAGRVSDALTPEDLLRLLRRFPPGEMSHARARETAAELLVRDKLEVLREKLLVPLTDEEIADLSGRAGAALKADEANKEKEAEEKPPEPRDESRLVDWHAFDFDRSGHLDKAELQRLVAELRARPDRMIFRQFLQPDSEWMSHPTMRRRLLFLYEMFVETEGTVSRKAR
jgi:hypothetical protein